MNAERAAREIVTATKRGEREVILSLPANLLARFHALFPSPTIDLFALVNHLLPAPGGEGTASERGQEVQQRLHSPWLDTMTVLGRSAARRYQHAPASTNAASE